MRASSISTAILGLLDHEEEHTHLSAAEVYDALKGQFSAVNRSTVYRALKRLVDEGEVSISDMGMGHMVYEKTGREPHHHLVCQSCRRILTIGDGEVADFFSTIEDGHAFHVETTHLVLYGVCRNCRKSG